MQPQLHQEVPARVCSPDVVVCQLLQDLHIGLIFEGFSLQCSLKDLVSELIDRACPLGWVVTHVLEYRWEVVKEGLVDEGDTLAYKVGDQTLSTLSYRVGVACSSSLFPSWPPFLKP